MMTLTLSAGLPERLPEIAKADTERPPERPPENLAENLAESLAESLADAVAPGQSDQGPPGLTDDMSVRDMDDHQLLAATGAGVEEAFLEITRRYRNQITNYVYRMLDDYDRAVDLTQETFVRVWVNAGRYQATYSFSTYIYKIAHNLAISELRQRKRRRTIQLPTFFSDKDNEEMEVEFEDRKQILAEDMMIGDEQRRAVSRAIASLPEKYRAALVLCDIEERSYDEISEVLGLPVGTVKSRINRARNLLKEKLRDYL
ncbi:MAG TPA: sigma-70 family RNA polymerase sigma factor [Blastocatellia bacterium]|nr:sigma-70 family RNA polymerase sigma factor [Blastocatellia bacterium]